MLGKLERKGCVRHVEDGPRYLYLPAVSTDRARRTAMRNLVDTFFDGSAERAAAALLRLSDTGLDPAALARITAEIERARKEGR
jgi:predicted transcriptional regulator